MIESSYCGDNAGWACNELGRYYAEGRIVVVDSERALSYFAKACELRFQAGCLNVLDPQHFTAAAVPRVFDLRLLLRERGPNLTEMPEPDLYRAGLPPRMGLRVSEGGELTGAWGLGLGTWETVLWTMAIMSVLDAALAWRRQPAAIPSPKSQVPDKPQDPGP